MKYRRIRQHYRYFLENRFGQVLQYIKYSKNKEKLYQVTHEEKRFSELDEDSANLINTVTGSDLKFEETRLLMLCSTR